MSTVMYCWRVKDADLWTVLESMRALYQREHYAFKSIANLARQARLADGELNQEAIKRAFARARETDLHVHAQLFRTRGGWLFRILEHGYFFLNHWEKVPGIQSVFYDDRTAVPAHERRNRRRAERIDEQIKAHQYLLANIVEQEALQSYFHDQLYHHNHEEDTHEL